MYVQCIKRHRYCTTNYNSILCEWGGGLGGERTLKRVMKDGTMKIALFYVHKTGKHKSMSINFRPQK